MCRLICVCVCVCWVPRSNFYQYPPYVVAAAAIHLAARAISKALPTGWWTLCETTREQLEDAALKILTIYELPSTAIQ